jgi:hypothetical protein
MPIRYAIQAEFDLLIYIVEGTVTAADYFNAYKAAYLDARRKHGMKVLVDLYNAVLEYEAHDFREAVAIVRENHEAGFTPDHVAVVVTAGSNFQYFIDTIKLLADEMPMYLSVFYSPYDALRWLGLAESETEALHFWAMFKSGADNAEV